MEFQKEYIELVTHLRKTRRKEKIYKLSAGLLYTIIAALATVLLMSIIEMIANGNQVFRLVLLISAIMIFIVAGLFFIYPEFRKAMKYRGRSSLEDIALRIGRHYTDLKDRLSNALQLMYGIENNKYQTSSTMVYADFQNISENISNKNFDVILDKKSNRKAILIFIIGLIAFVSSFLSFESSLGGSFSRIIQWNKSFVPPVPFSISIEPLNQKVLRNQNVKITIKAIGEMPRELSLFIKQKKQENYDEYSLRPDTNGVYVYDVNSIKESIEFFATANWLGTEVKTKIGKIEVIDRPIIRTISGILTYPKYTNLEPKRFNEQNADISALKGSIASFSIITNKEILNSRIVFIKNQTDFLLSNGTAVSKIDTIIYKMTTTGKKSYGSLKILNSGTYYIEVKDKDNETNDNPIIYSISALNDEYPSISFIEPTMDVMVNEQALLPMRISVSDDYGFSALKLRYRLIYSNYSQPQENFGSLDITMMTKELSMNIPYIWDLNKLRISPEDIFEFYLEVYDNDIVSGPKMSRTGLLHVKLPSLDEVLNKTDKEQENIEKDMKKVLKQSEELKKDIDELNKEILKNQNNKELSWKERKKAEEIIKKQEEINQKVNDLKDKLNNMTQQLQENNAISEETMQKYMELQKLMQEVDSPELRRMNEMMQNAMNKISPEDMKRAMENYKFDEERFKQSIERSLSILKRLKAEQKADALTKLAEELLKKQEELQKKLDNTNPNDKQKRDDLAREQDNLSKDLNNLNDDMNDLENLMKEIGKDMPIKEFNDAKDALDKNETFNQMQISKESISQADFNKSKKAQQKASQNLKDFLEKMKDFKNKMTDEVTQEAMRKMKKSINDMLQLSEKQEDLKSKAKNMEYNSTQFPEMAQNQAEMMESLGNIAKGMMELSQKSFSVTPEMGKNIGDALNNMDKSLDGLSSRNPHNSSQSMSDAMTSMNNAIMNMQSQLSMMQNQGNGSCQNPGGMGSGQSGMNGNQGGGMPFMQRLQQAATAQQAINQSMQKLGSGGQLSQEERSQLGKIAKEQGNAQKAVQQLSEEQKQWGASGEKKALGNLDKVAQEMKEVISDIESGQITSETLKRQERILSRLLDASRSMHDRDFEKKRESKTGENVSRQSPGAIDMSTQEGRTRAIEELLESIQQGYTKDYETIIRKYFEALQSKQIQLQ